jgi:hypothetical protein
MMAELAFISVEAQRLARCLGLARNWPWLTIPVATVETWASLASGLHDGRFPMVAGYGIRREHSVRYESMRTVIVIARTCHIHIARVHLY